MRLGQSQVTPPPKKKLDRLRISPGRAVPTCSSRFRDSWHFSRCRAEKMAASSEVAPLFAVIYVFCATGYVFRLARNVSRCVRGNHFSTSHCSRLFSPQNNGRERVNKIVTELHSQNCETRAATPPPLSEILGDSTVFHAQVKEAPQTFACFLV